MSEILNISLDESRQVVLLFQGMTDDDLLEFIKVLQSLVQAGASISLQQSFRDLLAIPFPEVVPALRELGSSFEGETFGLTIPRSVSLPIQEIDSLLVGYYLDRGWEVEVKESAFANPFGIFARKGSECHNPYFSARDGIFGETLLVTVLSKEKMHRIVANFVAKG